MEVLPKAKGQFSTERTSCKLEEKKVKVKLMHNRGPHFDGKTGERNILSGRAPRVLRNKNFKEKSRRKGWGGGDGNQNTNGYRKDK